MRFRRPAIILCGATLALAVLLPMRPVAGGHEAPAAVAVERLRRVAPQTVLADAWALAIFLSPHALGLMLAARYLLPRAKPRAALRHGMAVIVALCWLGALLRAASEDLPPHFVTAYVVLVPVLFVLLRPWAKSRIEILAGATILWRAGEALARHDLPPALPAMLCFGAAIALAALMLASVREPAGQTS